MDFNDHARNQRMPNGQLIGDGDVKLPTDKRVIFVRDFDHWERVRKRMVDQMSRYGFTAADRSSVSIALDETISAGLECLNDERFGSRPRIAYSIGPEVIQISIRFSPRAVPDTGPLPVGSAVPESTDAGRWLLSAICMSGFRLTHRGFEIDMWRNNSARLHPPCNS